jgi:hypothetical protein
VLARTDVLVVGGGVGEAAGQVAVLALEGGGDAWGVDVALLRRRLVTTGAILDYFDAADSTQPS